MVSTNLITFEISFQNNGNESFIFNTTLNSTNELTNILKSRKLYFSKVKEFNRVKGNFKRCSKQRLLNCIDFNTELYNLLK